MATRAKITRGTRTKRKSTPWRKLKIAAVLFFIPLAAGVLAGGTYFAFLMNNAAEIIPTLDSKMEAVRLGPTRILSADGKVLYESAAEFRIPVEITDVPKVVQDATLAAEDKRFYDHIGVDPWAIGRQVFTNVKEQRVAGGASTLTMQLAKRLYTSPDQTVKRKLEDAALALQMERKLTKDQLLSLYLNQVFYGAGAYGIAAAADVYFGKKLSKLTISEAAMIARCVRRPSQENPYVNYKRALENRDVVLRTMLEENMITQAEFEKALADRPKLADGQVRLAATMKGAPYFVRYVLDTVREELGEDIASGGYTIETTLDSGLQEFAEARAKRLVSEYRRSGVTTAAFTIMNRSGEILAMVGGVDYSKNQFNVVTQGRRQPGSAFKPLVYAAAFEQGVLSINDSLRADTFRMKDGNETWTVEGRRSASSISVQAAIASSANPPAVRAMMMVRPSVFVGGYSKRVYGLTTPVPAVPSMVLGSVEVHPMELAEAFSVFQLSGDRLRAMGVRRILDLNGKVIHKFEPRTVKNVMSSSSAEDMDYCLRRVVTGGTGSYANSVLRARGKTGTTNDNKDAWFVGYTDNYLAVSWVANETYEAGRKRWVYRPMSNYVMGGKVPVLLWRDVMKEAQRRFGEPAVRPDPDRNDREREAYVTDDGESSQRMTNEMSSRREPAPEEAAGPDEAIPSVDQPAGGAGVSPAPEVSPEPSLPDGNQGLPDDPGGEVPPPEGDG